MFKVVLDAQSKEEEKAGELSKLSRNTNKLWRLVGVFRKALKKPVLYSAFPREDSETQDFRQKEDFKKSLSCTHNTEN